MEQLAALPGIGKNRARKIFLPDANLMGLEDYVSFD